MTGWRLPRSSAAAYLRVKTERLTRGAAVLSAEVLPFGVTQRGNRYVVPGTLYLVLKSPEDTVHRKLLWFQTGAENNSQQFRDVVEVLRFQGERLDVGYLSRWASQLNLTRLLERVRIAALKLSRT